MSDPVEGPIPQTQSAFSGGPPRPPKITVRDLEDEPDDPRKIIYISEPVVVKELAAKLSAKPFKIVADLLEMGHFKYPEDSIGFETAWLVAQKHGYTAIRIEPRG